MTARLYGNIESGSRVPNSWTTVTGLRCHHSSAIRTESCASPVIRATSFSISASSTAPPTIMNALDGTAES